MTWNWDLVSALSDLLGGIAVVASLLFVGYQLRQQAHIERASAQRDLLAATREWVSLPSRSEAHFNAIRRCLDDFDGTDAWSRQLFWDWAVNILLILETALYMQQNKFVHGGSFERFEQLVLSIVRASGGRQWWNHMYRAIGVDVAEHVARLIVEIGDEVPPWNELMPHFKSDAPADPSPNPAPRH